MADDCIVGEGYTGLSVGITPAEAGMKLLVLEQARMGWGASGRNCGQIMQSYSRDIDVIEPSYGAAPAKPLADLMFEGARIIRERLEKYNLDCGLKYGGIFSAISPHKAKGLEAQKKLW